MIAITVSLVLVFFADISLANRLPLEVFEVPQSTQVYSTSGGNYLKHNPGAYNHRADQRRSRQMLDALQPQDTRILYQIGDSEDDLPICAPNAVCSKIDLYETPWIERQCRCPESKASRGPLTITHRKDQQLNEQKYKQLPSGGEEKNQHHLRLLDLDEKRFETVHLRKLLQKFGAVYQDDIMLDENDFQDNENLYNAYQNHKNEFAFAQFKNHDTAKLRHAAHHKDISHLGGCPSNVGAEDGHTIADKTRHYKLCNPVHKLPICRYFRDYTWTLSSSPEVNVTEQVVHCRCPRNSVTYLTKREALPSGRTGYKYLFACSPQSRLRCQRKEPCKLFTVRKRQEFLDEVNTNPLCQCPKGHRCPKHHTDPGVIAGKSYIEDNIQTYSGYCMAND